MFKSVRFDNFKGLKEYTVTLRKMNVLVGPNNAGKSTVLDSFRALSAAVKYAGRRNPCPLSVQGHLITAWDIPWPQIPISLANIHSDYRDNIETTLTFTLTSGRKLRLSFYENSRAILTVEDSLSVVHNIYQFRKAFPIAIASITTLGPLEEEGHLLTDEYVERWRGSKLTHRMFRNIWYRQSDQFSDFKALVEKTWPGMSVRPPERHGFAPAKLTMFCEENRMARELSWAGFGFQVWLQILTHLIGATPATMLIVDEPEIYLHPDLQHRLFALLRSSEKQVVLATHSVEIINEAEHDDVVLVNRIRRSAKRVGNIEGLQEALFSIGSAQNIHLAKLSQGKKILFLEGQDYKLVKRFAARIWLPALSQDVKLTVIPLGGFTQRQRIEEAAWIFEKVLRAEIAIAALPDRDYRCNEEIDALVANMRVTVPRFHVLPAKEIENYLLVPGAISCAAQDRLRERATGKIEMDAVSEIGIESILLKCTDEVKADVSAQVIAHRSTFFNGRDSRDQATVVAETLRNLDSDWADVRRRLAIVPGKQILTALNRELQATFRILVTPLQIIRHMAADQVDQGLRDILADLNAFASG